MGLYQTVGLILITDITFRNVYTASEGTSEIKVIAGTAAFNSTFVSLVPAGILNLFASSYTEGFLTDPRFVTEIPPINCKSNCSSTTSIFLPGSLELVRLDNGNRQSTLFTADLPGDSILINNAPGFQVEFSPVRPEFKFNSTDCEIYMHSLGDGLYICAASDGLQMNVGWTICPSALATANTCSENTTWTEALDQSTTVAMYKRYATTAYNLKNVSIMSIESISAPEQSKIDPSDFTFFCDLVLGSIPKNLNYSDPVGFNAGASRYTVQFGLGWILRLYKDEFNRYNNGGLTLLQGLIAVPLQFSTSIWQQSGYSTLPADMKVTATVATASYRAIIPFWTVLVFGVLASILLFWSITCLAWAYFLGPATPNTSPFPEVDITSKTSVPAPLMPVYDTRFGGMPSHFFEDLGKYMRSSGLGNSTGRSAIQALRERKIYCGACVDPQTGEPHIAIVTERGIVAPLQEHVKYA